MWFWQRWRARRMLETDIGLWFHPDYAAPGLLRESRMPHVESRRAQDVLRRVSQWGLVRPEDIRQPSLATLTDLTRVHPAAYLAEMARPEKLARVFGLLPEQVDVDALLSAQRRAVGGTVAAALSAARGERRIAFNLGGGFHHAAPTRGGGFCVFNDVAVAIARLRAEGFDAPIAIVDLDFHQGDGNLEAFATDPSVMVFSIHGAQWTAKDSAASRNYGLPSGTGDQNYLACLDEYLKPALVTHDTKLIFYLAGSDVLAGDVLGDFALSHAGVFLRDRRVVTLSEMLGAPMVVTMAGGYSAGAWQSTLTFLRWLLSGVQHVDQGPQERLREQFSRVAQELDPWELQRDAGDLDFSEQDLLGDLSSRNSHRLLLGYYTRHGVEFALERYGFFEKLRTRGFIDVQVDINLDDPSRQIVRVRGRRAGMATSVVLVELMASRRSLAPPLGMEGEEPLAMLHVEWLLLQDPTIPFTPDKPRLPGQEYPGLGMAAEIQELLIRVCERLSLDGISHRPSHYHNAVWAWPTFHFLDPVIEGQYLALRRVLAAYPIAQASDWVMGGKVALGDGKPFRWAPEEFVMPVSERLKDYFASEAYGRRREDAYAERERLGVRVVE